MNTTLWNRVGIVRAARGAKSGARLLVADRRRCLTTGNDWAEPRRGPPAGYGELFGLRRQKSIRGTVRVCQVRR